MIAKQRDLDNLRGSQRALSLDE